MAEPGRARRRVASLTAAAVIAAGLSGCGLGATTTPVEGYLDAGSGAASRIDASADAISIVGVDGVNLTPDGSDLTATPDGVRPIVRRAHAAGLRAELLVGNFDGDLGDFSPEIATRLLGEEERRRSVAEELARRVDDGGFDGVQLDLESLDASHADGLAAFAADVRAALPDEAELSMAVMASDSVDGYAEAGYELTALQRSVSRFVLMAYDQHGPGWSGPGPIGGTPWVRRALTALEQAGLPPAMTDLGVAAYGDRWDEGGQTGDLQLSVARSRELAGDAASWSARQQEWTAELDDGSVLWWSDERTLDARRELARQRGLHGVAVWQLGTSDPIG